MTRPAGVQRLWRFEKPRRDAVAAIVTERVPGFVERDLHGEGIVVAVVSFARVGEPELRQDSAGRELLVRPLVPPTHQRGMWFENLEDAMEWLDAWKSDLEIGGWTEIPVDALNDPDE